MRLLGVLPRIGRLPKWETRALREAQLEGVMEQEFG